MKWVSSFSLFFCVLFFSGIAGTEEIVGKRPYEMEWAHRTADTHPPLIDFENLEGWTVQAKDAEAGLTRSREQQLWGKYVSKLVYRATGREPLVTLRPPKPIPVASFDSIDFWVYGNNWAWAPSRSTPQVGVRLLFEDAQGKPLSVNLGRVRWKQWWVMHRRLGSEERARMKQGAHLTGIAIDNGRNKDDRTLYFDNLACYIEPLPPLTFKPRPKRGIEMFPGQLAGTNTGPGRLPFPTREETILPDNLTKRYKTSLSREGAAYVFRYEGSDGTLEYRYEPKTGPWDDLTARWRGRGDSFQPLAGGGALFWKENSAAPEFPEEYQLLECRRTGDTVAATWRLSKGPRRAEVTYTFRLWQKSLVIDVRAVGGEIGQVRFGRAAGAANPRLVTIPYLVGESSRPAVLVMGPPRQPLFLMGLVDYYRTNASKFWFSNQVRKNGVTYNGGTTYIPKTDGKYNDCFERFFLTISPKFEEILPNIPNPKSPWMQVAGERLWRAHGAGNRERDLAFWKSIARYGMTKVVITDHETGWRDGGESFTFRTRTAPGKGGDESQAWYSRELHKLGFRYGIYNNYTDFAPVNGYWDPDRVGRHPDGNWMAAWARCYAPKPARAVEFEAMLAPIIQGKFHLSTAYCDVHTAVYPWSRVDYDARVPGAGTLAQQFYCYGEIMLHQKKTWNGPVYSEGNNHYYYSGLTDGNYAQDQRGKLPTSPWLVDFDLRKMHPLNCNFGMGNPGMFYGRKKGLGASPEERTRRLDRFLAATLAFGHTGFLVRIGGTRSTVRSYFMLQQVHKHYARERARTIRYANARGELLDTTAAIATGAFRRSQILTEYSNGLLVAVNGNPSETWQVRDSRIGLPLPPNGYFALLPGEGPKRDPVLKVFSAGLGGHRVDYAETSAYVYADGRGRFTRFDAAASDGALIALRPENAPLEVIPVEGCNEFGVSVAGQTATARALDQARKDLGTAPVRFSRGLIYISPKDGAFSYLLNPAGPPKIALTCERDKVVPGESVVVRGQENHPFRVPTDSQPYSRLWKQFEGAWIDFTVLPLARIQAAITSPRPESPTLDIAVFSNLKSSAAGKLQVLGQEQAVRLRPGEPARFRFPITRPKKEKVFPAPIRLILDDRIQEQPEWIKAEESVFRISDLSGGYQAGMRLRGAQEETLRPETGAHVYPRESTCGNRTRQGMFMHPPYRLGVGYSFALYQPVVLPPYPPAVFRCQVGKGNGSDPGDGILFRVAVIDEKGKETAAAEKQWIKHDWTPLEADLSPWAGQRVRLKIISDVGPGNNSSGDWACWGDLAIQSRDPMLALSLHSEKPRLKYGPGPYPVKPLRLSDLRSARRGWLHFRSIGLQNDANYRNEAEVCGIRVGLMPSSKGASESQGKWGKEARMPLPPEAIAKLGPTNPFVLHNLNNDCFKVRGFWIELELSDGRKCSSKIASTIYTQPSNWAYAEGTKVDFTRDITEEIPFDIVK